MRLGDSWMHLGSSLVAQERARLGRSNALRPSCAETYPEAILHSCLLRLRRAHPGAACLRLLAAQIDGTR
jgi:hypothetical protein